MRRTWGGEYCISGAHESQRPFGLHGLLCVSIPTVDSVHLKKAGKPKRAVLRDLFLQHPTVTWTNNNSLVTNSEVRTVGKLLSGNLHLL